MNPSSFNDPLYAALEARSMLPDAVVPSAGALVDFVHGYCLSPTSATRQQELHQAFEVEQDKQPSDTTKTLRHLHSEEAASNHDGFCFGLDVILNGLDNLSTKDPH